MRWGLLLASLMFMCLPALAQRERAQLWCEQGGQTVTVNGVVSSTKVQRSYPSCTVTVFDNGTSNLTSICSDAACSTPIANPFTSTSTGYITFFAHTEPAIVDVQQSGAGLATPLTIRGLQLCDVTTCLGGGGGGGGSVSGTPPHIAKFTSATAVGDSVGQDNGTNPTSWPLGLSLGSNALYTVKTNNATTGTTLNLLVSRDASGNAITAQPTDTNNLIGVADAGAGLTGSVTIAYSGTHACKFDNQSAIADWVVLGTAGQCHDAGAVEPAGVQNIGRVATINTGAGTTSTIDMGLPDVVGISSVGNGVVGPCAAFPGPIAYYTAIQTLTCDSSATLDGNGNYTGASATYAGSGGGFVAFGQGGAPSFSQANSFYFYAPATITTSVGENIVAGSRRVCMMTFGADAASAVLVSADIAPQLERCQIPYSATVFEIDVTADGGTPTVIVGKRHCTASPCASNFTVTNLVSSTLTTAASGGPACSNTGGTAGLDTFTTCAATLQNTTVAIGDYIETVSATAGGTAKRLSIAVHFVVN